jgi:hypothetical protein
MEASNEFKEGETFTIKRKVKKTIKANIKCVICEHDDLPTQSYTQGGETAFACASCADDCGLRTAKQKKQDEIHNKAWWKQHIEMIVGKEDYFKVNEWDLFYPKLRADLDKVE